MAIETPNIDEVSFESFETTIKNCKTILEKKIKAEKNPVKADKYKNALTVYNAGLEKYNKVNEVCKNMKVADTTGNEVSFYDEVVKARGAAINLATVQYEMNEWIEAKKTEGKKLTADSIKQADEFDGLDLSVEEVNVHYNPIDRCKKAGLDILNGRGVAKGIMTTAAVVGIGDILCKGVTTVLAKEGIISGALDLVGLGKLGIQNLPALGELLAGGLKTFAEFSTLGLAGGAVILGLAAIPVVKGIIDKVKAKHKNAVAVEQALADELNKGQVALS